MKHLHAIAFDRRVGRVEQSNEDGVAFLTRMTAGSEVLRVLASCGYGWDHVSVSTRHRCPTWEEMEFVRSICFHDHETAMQLSVPRKDHIDHHPHCLHLWRPHEAAIPRPPGWMVGPEEIAGKKFEKG